MDAQSSGNDEQKLGFMRQAWNRVNDYVEADRKKWFGMTLGAMFRLGLAELREAFSWHGGNIAPPTPLGMYGTLTPGEVGDARDNDNPNIRRMEEEPRKNDKQRSPSPSQVADGKSSATVHGETQQAGKQNQPSPSGMSEGQGQKQNQGQQQGREHGLSRGRGM